jgi:HNH endonuclease
VNYKHPNKTCPYLRISAGPLRGRYVHDLVMEAKLGRRLNVETETVEHLDGDGLNPHPDNLIVVTREENSRLRHEREKAGRNGDCEAIERGIPEASVEEVR